jgi:hypothetical protein
MPACLGRRAAIGLVAMLALAGCVEEAPPPEMFAPLTYGYLTKLRLNVANIAIDDSWTPSMGAGEHVESLSPVQPLQALVEMARDRLVASGTSGQARFIVQDASIIAGPGRLDGSLAVRLEVTGADGRSGYAEARVIRSRTGGPGDPDGGRNAAYQLTKNMMDDMNVELEYQVRHRLGDFLLATSTSAPPPAPVEQQELPPPPGAAPESLPPVPGS